MVQEGEFSREFQMREFYDELRAKYRRERMPTDLIDIFFAPVVSAAEAVLGSFTVGAGLTSGTFADVYDVHVSCVGIVDPNAYAALVDRRRGTIDQWYLGTAPGQRRYLDLRAPSIAMPLYAGLQGSVRLIVNGAATGSFVGRMRAYIDHDGTETAWQAAGPGRVGA